MKKTEPKTLYILMSDYLAMLATIAPLVAWGLYVASLFGLGVTSRHSNTSASLNGPLFLGIAIVVTLLGVALVYYRVNSIRRVFANGVRVTGTITNVHFDRDRGRAEYRFMHGEREIQTGTALHRNERSSKLEQGQEVDLVVDPKDPERAFIVDLYC